MLGVYPKSDNSHGYGNHSKNSINIVSY